MTITKYVASWLKSADDDVKSSEILMKSNLYNPVCFHCQQAVEKLLKGFLAFNDKHVRKVHDLPELVGLCAQIDESFKNLFSDALRLDGFYIKARYLDDEQMFTQADAQQAYVPPCGLKIL